MIKTKKSFGQHLLTDNNYLNEIVNHINPNKDDLFVEIGAGTGILTIPVARMAKKVIAIEFERDIAKELKENLKKNNLNNVKILENNFLSTDLESLFDKPFRIIGNIPYNITSKILIKLLGEIDSTPKHLSLMKDIHLLMQYEVAERVVAKPGVKSFSPLSMLVQFSSTPELLCKVPKTAFTPPPKVESALVGFKIKREYPKISNPVFLKKVIRTAFQQKRKKILNSLSGFATKDELINIFKGLNLSPDQRPEDFNFNDYLLISENLLCKS